MPPISSLLKGENMKLEERSESPGSMLVGFEATGCCAFTQLRVSYNKNINAKKLDKIVEWHAAGVKERWQADVASLYGGGAPTIWCVAAPGEDKLRDYLKSHGWTHLMNLPRRNGYPPGINTMWVKGLPKE